MANPNWVKGGSSPNPQGRRKMRHSSRSIKGVVERFLHKNYSPRKLQELHDKMSASKKVDLFLALIPYAAPKQTQLSVNAQFDHLSDADLEKLYTQVMGSIGQPEPIRVNDITTLIPAPASRYVSSPIFRATQN